ncbi:tetratricopeptide repeat protein [Epilithonimonas sp.]|uniref:tetratricopeptide repeat protein n=1 Tax=Epilithonimonas sp. TaxID=2894511 RepID=UPI0035ADCD0C
MKKLLLILIAIYSLSLAQTKKEFALEKGKAAIKLMDEGKIDESILLLKESQELDPDNFDYPYEIAYAYCQKKDYQTAINIIEKLENYKNVNFQLYQIWGNAYDLLGKPAEAIKIYDLGIKKFPNKAALFLEKGVVYEFEKKYDKAIETYQNGIAVEPKYPSNYYRLSKLFLNSKNIVPGLIYGEIFLNLERTTNRSLEMSELLYNSYKNAITFESDTKLKIDFCEAIIDLKKYEKDKKLPFCSVYGKSFILALLNVKQFNLDSFATVRKEFLKLYFKKDYKEYPNFLLNYLKKVSDHNFFDAYNHYIFQMGAQKEFEDWSSKNKNKYEKFIEWYVNPENIINPTKENFYKYEY